ncbi:hypothetical protein ADK60_07225 [Streptomyces sp. XY431]|uniref:hypothetical protein n=1 Tax=Streptomyces sp. XY431 TaxID=1415562 RepID=UPI0006AF68CB|nr:hypothetical protein [Streptomyces sp. XY431]KOV36227.1 hypothetical protein ADK60_07225 [Streptomyces sp. XY431]
MVDTGLLQQSLDDLLCRILPDRPQPSLPCNAGAQERYERLEATRLRVGETLAADPALTVHAAGDVLPLLTLDDNHTSQLVFPLVAALGRRPVLTFLVAHSKSGSWRTRTNSCSAAYWVSVWRSTTGRDEIITATRNGALTGEQARALLQQDARHPHWRTSDQVGDLWPSLWAAAADTFVHCQDNELRQRLQTAFPLNAGHYPPGHGPLLDRARTIAEDMPDVFDRLLANKSGYGIPI